MDTTLPENEQLRIDVSGSTDRVVVKLLGELDLATAPQLRECLVAVGHDNALEVVLDFEDLKFIDSVGLSVVIAEHKRLQANGGVLIIQFPSARTRKLFDTSGLNPYLTIRPPIVPDEVEAER